MRLPIFLTLLLSTSLSAQAKAAKTAVDFEKEIWPILQSRCVECHATAKPVTEGKPKKPKGGVTLDTKEGITASKKGTLFIAKKPDDSLVYTSITLAADHEDRMPSAKAKDNTPLPKEQTDLIKKWIEEGASFGKWTGKDEGKPKEQESEKPKAGDKPKDEPKDKPKDKPKG